ncbi:class I SAM-dependent methyltransferase [Mycolicibacterium mengxianglii]|uniref:class I SAM-dependent methyltransferase n=1 Tax=Mycolicibacterium mengxianglii TaxID=2736649 RepID=UPI001E641F2A|nr:class I SAM-dependent methyltransferase [Mycolicibacterium mengxianglii]
MTNETPGYVFSGESSEESSRLGALETLWDPGSKQVLSELGVGPGWRCLEIGPGGGSLVEWIAERGAAVTAIDIDTRFIDHLDSELITVRRADIREEEFPRAEFDLVHARLVLEHLSDRRELLDKLAATLRPGGWMVIEDMDWTTFGLIDDSGGAFSRVAEVVIDFMARTGFEPNYGGQVIGDLVDAGLVDVRGEGRCRVIDSRSTGFDFFRLTFDSLREALVGAGLVTNEEAAAMAAGFAQDVRLCTPLMVAGIGRRA